MIRFISGLADQTLDFFNWLFKQVVKAEASQRPDLYVWTGDDTAMPLDASLAREQPSPTPVSLLADREHDVAALQKVDANFTEVAFVTQATRIYQSSLAAEGAMRLDSIAASVTPAFAERLRARIKDWQTAGLRRVVMDVSIDGATILKMAIDGLHQALTVRFTGSAVRYTEDPSSGVAVEGSMRPDYFTEFATFVRPAGATTAKAASDAMPSHCPFCGAPAEAGAIYCGFCGSSLLGSSGTWQLDKISESAYT